MIPTNFLFQVFPNSYSEYSSRWLYSSNSEANLQLGLLSINFKLHDDFFVLKTNHYLNLKMQKVKHKIQAFRGQSGPTSGKLKEGFEKYYVGAVRCNAHHHLWSVLLRIKFVWVRLFSGTVPPKKKEVWWNSSAK